MINNLTSRLSIMVAVAAFSSQPTDAANPLAERRGRNRLKVQRQGDLLYIRSGFSADRDIVLIMTKGVNQDIRQQHAFLLPPDFDGELDWENLNRYGTWIHSSGGETPWNMNGTYIGASHGCSSSRTLTCPGHNLTIADLGSQWKDEKGMPLHVVKIVDENKFWVLPENIGEGPVWKFDSRIRGEEIKEEGGQERTLRIEKATVAQLVPCLRINGQSYLADGKVPSRDGEMVECDFLEIVDDHDVINPASVLEAIKNNPGVKVDFVSDEREAIVNNHITFRVHPGVKTVLYYKTKALAPFDVGQMSFIMARALLDREFDALEYYIPKTLPFSMDGIEYDFRGIQDFTVPIKGGLRFRTAHRNIEDPCNLPDRFIQFLENNGKREVGFAMGYSLINGDSVPAKRAELTGNAAMIWRTRKSYPFALDREIGRVPAGRDFYCVCYRNYFDPSRFETPTCVYWHEEGDDTVVYVDYHQSVQHDRVKLPETLTGREFTVVEKTPSLTLNTTRTVPEEGLDITVDQYGYVVLRVGEPLNP